MRQLPSHTPGVHDPLAPFRVPGSIPAAQPDGYDRGPQEGPTERAAPEPQEGPSEPEPEPWAGYRAYAVASNGNRPQRLEIRGADGVCFARAYHTLNEVTYDRTTCGEVLLLFLAKIVTFKGRNLQPVIEALIAGSCEFIAQIGEGEQAEEGAPVIDELTVITPGETPAGEGEG